MRWKKRKIGGYKVKVCGDWEKWTTKNGITVFNNKISYQEFPVTGYGESDEEAFCDFVRNLLRFKEQLDNVESEIRQMFAENYIRKGSKRWMKRRMPKG